MLLRQGTPSEFLRNWEDHVTRLFLMGLLLWFPPGTALAQASDVDEDAVWALEEAYWQYVEANDIESYRALWDERFVGWPGGSAAPVEKPQIADWIVPLHADPGRVFRYDLERKAVRAFGDIVVTHLLYRGYFVSADTGEVVEQWATGKITHTWRRDDGNWRIITGMAGRVVSEASE